MTAFLRRSLPCIGSDITLKKPEWIANLIEIVVFQLDSRQIKEKFLFPFMPIQVI